MKHNNGESEKVRKMNIFKRVGAKTCRKN